MVVVALFMDMFSLSDKYCVEPVNFDSQRTHCLYQPILTNNYITKLIQLSIKGTHIFNFLFRIGHNRIYTLVVYDQND